GLVTDEDFRADKGRIERLGRWIEDNMTLNRAIMPLGKIKGQGSKVNSLDSHNKRGSTVKIGIARDEAFCFYYPENLMLLEEAGAELIPFSPLRARRLPDGLKGIILGGGYPELHCEMLSQNRELLGEIKEFGLGGRPIYAECGGFMFLTREILDLKGQAFPMVGIFPVKAKMEHRLKALGYREVLTRKKSILGPADTKLRGHEFHYSQIQNMETTLDCIYSMTDRKAVSSGEEGFIQNRVLGSYVHLHWGSNPEVANNFVEYCRQYG
ncbi:MAG: cobyrinate a,c-diamide synthase, partial [Deltaproteobacteria bacterium]|nr:cobyrinate a,c-diamide synthase [Deltaproteobacteria bacterium]